MLFKHRTLTALGLIFALAPIPLIAAENEDDDTTEVVTVISNRLPSTEKDIGSSITVLDNEEIVESQKVSVLDLLRGTPGVSVSRNGGIGTVSTLRLRGAESGQTLVLIDGVKVNDLSTPAGEFNFANLTTDAIERIEILRGPQSTLYGSDAIGGVINIITKRADGPLKVSGFVEGGSFGTFRGGVDFGLRSQKTSFNLSLGGTRTDGISAADENAGNAERDGFRTISVIARAVHELTDNLSFNAFFRHADSRAEFDAFDFNTFGFIDGDGVTDSEDRQIALGVVWDWLSGKATTDAKISFARTERFDEEFQMASFSSLSKNRTIDLLNTFRVSDQVTVLIGGQLQDNEISFEVFGFFASTLMRSVDIKSIFAEIAAKPIENVTLTFGVRHDDHQIFGGHTTFRITGNWQIPKTGTTFRANWGEGFKAPTLFQLFSSFDEEFQMASFSSLSKNRTIDLLNTFRVSDQVTVLIGGQLQDNEISFEVFGFFASTLMRSVDIKSIFAEIAAKPIENVTLTFGVRHDDHQIFGGHTTFRITGNWQIPKTGTTFRANWGEGFKAPTLFQLFSSFGDPTLQPETSTGWEIGLEQNIIKDRATVSVTYFQRKNNNLIDFSLISFTFANILQTRAKGVEVVFEAKFTDKLSLSGNFTHLDATNTLTGLALSRRPKNIFNASVVFDATDRLSISGGINATSRQIDGFAVLSPFKVIDLRASYKVSDQISLFGRIENAFDEQYQEVTGFGTPGISAYGGVRGSF